jgi:hypothetical protein
MTPIPLSKSDRSTKILITLFLLTMLAAFAVAELNVFDKVGRIRRGVAVRYGPDAPPAETARQDEENESAAETEPLAVRLNTFASLLDITHPHVFQIPLILFVLAHFLMRTRAPGWFKLANYVGSFTGAILFMAAPWLVRYVSVAWAGSLYVGAALAGGTSLAMIVTPLWDMWIPSRTRRR